MVLGEETTTLSLLLSIRITYRMISFVRTYPTMLVDGSQEGANSRWAERKRSGYGLAGISLASRTGGAELD
jgi:hypothetical protein